MWRLKSESQTRIFHWTIDGSSALEFRLIFFQVFGSMDRREHENNNTSRWLRDLSEEDLHGALLELQVRVSGLSTQVDFIPDSTSLARQTIY